MTIDLTSYAAIQTALFIKIVIPGYTTLLLSDYGKVITIAGDSYTGIGEFMAITDTSNELMSSNQEITITISGLTGTRLQDMMNYKVKGSSVQVLRAVFDPITGVLLSIAGNPVGKFYGLVNNYTLNETWSGVNASNTISFICTSTQGLLEKKKAGRRTNPADQKLYFPSDLSMDRIPNIANAELNFGAP